MKAFALLLLTGLLFPTLSFAEENLSERLAGYILLQVEGRGEAWYVHPDTGLRYYMKDGPTAYEMMRQFGLGISESDFSKLPTDEEMKDRLKGRILLRVQARGEAYYVNPIDERITYMKDGSEAYNIMRMQSLGITDENLGAIEPKAIELPSGVSSIVIGDTDGNTNTVIIHEVQPIVVLVEQEPETSETEETDPGTDVIETQEEPEESSYDVQGEIENIIAKIKASDSFNASAIWWSKYGDEQQAALEEWKRYSGCNRITQGSGMSSECQQMEEETDTQALQSKHKCWGYISWESTMDCSSEVENPPTEWEVEVLKPLSEAYFQLFNAQKAVAESVAARTAVSALEYWTMNLNNPGLIQDWHFELLVTIDVTTDLDEYLYN